jgi:hypothetical protein
MKKFMWIIRLLNKTMINFKTQFRSGTKIREAYRWSPFERKRLFFMEETDFKLC